MAPQINRLNPLQVQRIQKSGRHGDGHGLYLECSDRGSKAWIFRFMMKGRARTMGLGPYPVISLADGKTKALECKKLLLAGVDPIEARRSKLKEEELNNAKTLSFDECAALYIESHKIGWKNAKHSKQWESTLKTYASPIFGSLPIKAIDTALVMRVLEPIWQTKPETASRLRGWIELVLSWATTRGYREGDNPARWRGHLDTLLPKHSSVKKVKYFTALPLNQVGDFIATLRGEKGTVARALEFLILCASRTGEVLGAKWDEINLEDRIWTIPAHRMKAKKEHRVPLSSSALEILEEMQSLGTSYVFPIKNTPGKLLPSNGI